MNSINYPNKTFVLDKKIDHFFGSSTHFIVIAAVDKETASKHLKDILNLEVHPNELVWLMDTNYKTIYDTNGKTKDIQAQIQYHGSVHYDTKD